MWKPERIRDFIESAYLQIYLEAQGHHLVFIDEFHISMRQVSFYNWSKKGQPAIQIANPDSWVMSFIVGVSWNRVEGILAWTKSITTNIFIKFIKDLIQRFNSVEDSEALPVFILDNSSVHVNSKSRKFMDESNIRWVSIPPYSPQLNAAEKLIASIKSKIKCCWIEGRTLNLNIIKQIIDEMTTNSWKRWIESSRLETYFKLKQFEKVIE